jgi:hypothetical protein
LGTLLAQANDGQSPALSRFAISVAQQLCYTSNSAPCLEDDPEFRRVVAAFESSKFNFPTLIRELYSSPLVTNATTTMTTTQEPVHADRDAERSAVRLLRGDAFGATAGAKKAWKIDMSGNAISFADTLNRQLQRRPDGAEQRDGGERDARDVRGPLPVADRVVVRYLITSSLSL